jgi:GNAT superfamily N-acetyltransferase
VGHLEFAYLSDHQALIPTLRVWFETEWTPYYGPDGPGNAEADLLSFCNKNKMPIALVAFCGGELCATVALKHESITTHKHLSPWVAALLVEPRFRNKGVGTRVVAKIEKVAKELGLNKLYAGTSSAVGVLERNGWTFKERVPYFVDDVSIYEKLDI